MPLKTERLYDPSKPLYVGFNMRFDGRDYKRGDDAPTKDMSQRTIMRFFRTGYFTHDIRENTKAEPVKETQEVVAEEPKQEAPKTTTRKRRTKKDSE